ncbi:hypothetical protein [Slackia piriformis]
MVAVHFLLPLVSARSYFVCKAITEMLCAALTLCVQGQNPTIGV